MREYSSPMSLRCALLSNRIDRFQSVVGSASYVKRPLCTQANLFEASCFSSLALPLNILSFDWLSLAKRESVGSDSVLTAGDLCLR